MSFIVSVILLFVIGFLLWRYCGRGAGSSRLPPGPRGLPLLGYLPFLALLLREDESKAPHFDRLCKKYKSPLVSFRLGKRLVVVLGDHQTIRKALTDEAFSGRPAGDYFAGVNAMAVKNIMRSDGEHWKEHRRFALSTLRNFGIGKSSLEPMIVDEISQFLDVLAQKGSEPFDIRDLLSASVCNNICILEFGHRFEYDDPDFRRLYNAITFNVRAGGVLRLDNFLPWVRNLPGSNAIFRFQRRRNNAGNVNQYMREQVENHRSLNNAAPDDYISAYLAERNERHAKQDPTAQMFDDSALIANLNILFAAGMETTTTTLRWGLLYLMMHPEIQALVQAEIDRVIGRQRMPSSEDRTRMPYTEATLLEIQRCASVVPLSAVHRTTTDVELDGHVIPRDAIVFPNLWAVHNDERLFPDPKSFRPERFIDAEGRLVKHDHVIPFSLGKRFCLGEPLARMELFLYFTAMLQRFTFKYPQGRVLTLDSRTAGVSSPLPYELTVYARVQ